MTEADILNARILIVDDADANLRLLEELLAREDYENFSADALRIQVQYNF